MTSDPFFGGLMVLTMVVALVALMTSTRRNTDSNDRRDAKSLMERHNDTAQHRGRHTNRE
ncbi:hypothetical protein [uncultured Sulfitobacter sp.]|uniref:hypothetical protein n=1 Tax=uncultured Sulfitobacter sp. TaxID=191468 RepID=UPI002624CD92|nr:hypothetical protein [uncultured Sulfitobacter sp.]